MSNSLCKKYGFSQQGRQQRLDLIGLNSDAIPLIGKLQSTIISPHADNIVDKFYCYLFSQSPMLEFLDDETMVMRLKKTQRDYLKTLGVEFSSESYFETRLRIGLAHANIGLPLSLYQCAYNTLEELILELIATNTEIVNADKIKLIHVMLQLTTLDQSLAMETYFKSNIQNLKSSISVLEEKSAALRDEVNIDALTKVQSRQKILALLAHELTVSKESQMPLAVVMLDLDRFKLVNDRYGHLVGDDVLAHTAARIKSSLRDIDFVGRYGGEEFIIILPGSNRKTAAAITERIRKSIANSPVTYHQGSIPVTVSLGVTLAKQEDDAKSIISRADELMYRSKDNGRNCVTSD